MSALPAPVPSEWPVPLPPLRTGPRPAGHGRPAHRERSPHTRMIQSVMALFPGAEVVEHHPASRPQDD